MEHLGDILKREIKRVAPTEPTSQRSTERTPPRVNCSRCHDTLFILRASGDYTSIFLPCPQCLPPAVYTVANFKKVKGTEAAIEATRNFIKRRKPPWLVILGGHGAGKTHLARAVSRYCIEHMVDVRYVYSIDLFDTLRAGFQFRDDAGAVSQLERNYIQPEVLIVDDFGAEKESEWVRERTEKIFNYRYEKRLLTMITSNLKLEEFIPAIKSRMLDKSVCRVAGMTAQDYRLRKE